MVEGLTKGLRALRPLLQKSAPYVLMELLLPGGTLFALLLLVYQRRAALVANRQVLRPRPAVIRTLPGRVTPSLAPVWRLAA